MSSSSSDDDEERGFLGALAAPSIPKAASAMFVWDRFVVYVADTFAALLVLVGIFALGIFSAGDTQCYVPQIDEPIVGVVLPFETNAAFLTRMCGYAVHTNYFVLGVTIQTIALIVLSRTFWWARGTLLKTTCATMHKLMKEEAQKLKNAIADAGQTLFYVTHHSEWQNNRVMWRTMGKGLFQPSSTLIAPLPVQHRYKWSDETLTSREIALMELKWLHLLLATCHDLWTADLAFCNAYRARMQVATNVLLLTKNPDELTAFAHSAAVYELMFHRRGPGFGRCKRARKCLKAWTCACMQESSIWTVYYALHCASSASSCCNTRRCVRRCHGCSWRRRCPWAAYPESRNNTPQRWCCWYFTPRLALMLLGGAALWWWWRYWPLDFLLGPQAMGDHFVCDSQAWQLYQYNSTEDSSIGSSFSSSRALNMSTLSARQLLEITSVPLGVQLTCTVPGALVLRVLWWCNFALLGVLLFLLLVGCWHTRYWSSDRNFLFFSSAELHPDMVPHVVPVMHALLRRSLLVWRRKEDALSQMRRLAHLDEPVPSVEPRPPTLEAQTASSWAPAYEEHPPVDRLPPKNNLSCDHCREEIDAINGEEFWSCRQCADIDLCTNCRLKTAPGSEHLPHHWLKHFKTGEAAQREHNERQGKDSYEFFPAVADALRFELEFHRRQVWRLIDGLNNRGARVPFDVRADLRDMDDTDDDAVNVNN